MSLSSYMKKYAWKNAKTEDLWRVISEECGVNINSMMDCWTKQKGYPVIHVKSKDQVLEFEQVVELINCINVLSMRSALEKFICMPWVFFFSSEKSDSGLGFAVTISVIWFAW